MYAAGYGIRPLKAARHGAGLAAAGRVLAILLAGAGTSALLALATHVGSAPLGATVVVQPGDTLWSIAANRYPGDDPRARVDEIERLNRLQGPLIEAGETLRLPG